MAAARAACVSTWLGETRALGARRYKLLSLHNPVARAARALAGRCASRAAHEGLYWFSKLLSNLPDVAAHFHVGNVGGSSIFTLETWGGSSRAARFARGAGGCRSAAAGQTTSGNKQLHV